MDECYSDLDCTHTVCKSSEGSCQCIAEPGFGISECLDDLDCTLLSPDCDIKTACNEENQCEILPCGEGEPCEDLCLNEPSCCPEDSHTECEVGSCVCKAGVGQDLCYFDSNCLYHTECIFEQCMIIDGEGENQCDLYNGDADCDENVPPYAIDLTADCGVYCTGVPSAGIAYFSWKYMDIQDDIQKSFRFQIDDNSSFSSPEVDRFFDGLSYASGDTNNQTVYVRNEPTTPGGDYISYGITYYWRVMVQKYNGELSSDWIYYDGSYVYCYLHPAPVVNYYVLPESPLVNEKVYFSDSSICYSQSGPYACKGLPFGYTWTFGDGAVSNKSGDVSHSYATEGTFLSSLQICDEIDCCFAERLVPVTNETGTELPKIKEIAPY